MLKRLHLQQTVAIVRVDGYIDTTNTEELEGALATILKSNCYHIIIDLLKNSNFQDAISMFANLSGADLESANLDGAILAGADLSYANLRNANCRFADFEAANLDGANFENADMEGASFDNYDF